MINCYRVSTTAHTMWHKRNWSCKYGKQTALQSGRELEELKLKDILKRNSCSISPSRAQINHDERDLDCIEHWADISNNPVAGLRRARIQYFILCIFVLFLFIYRLVSLSRSHSNHLLPVVAMRMSSVQLSLTYNALSLRAMCEFMLFANDDERFARIHCSQVEKKKTAKWSKWGEAARNWADKINMCICALAHGNKWLSGDAAHDGSHQFSKVLSVEMLTMRRRI